MKEPPGRNASVCAKSRLRTKPKRYFVDPSIAVSLLGINADRMREGAQAFGLLFESLCIHEPRVLASLLSSYYADSLRYYGDPDGLKVNMIIELKDGRWAAVEIDLGEDKVSKGIANLSRVLRKVASNPAARNRELEFMMALVATPPMLRQDADNGVCIVFLTAFEP